MRTRQQTTADSQRHCHPFALRREGAQWHLTFEGRQTTFKHELGALYVACLLLDPPRDPIHGVALALKAKGQFSPSESREGRPCADDLLQERAMGLEEAAKVRALWHRQRSLERLLEDRFESEPVKAEALRELEEVTDLLRQSPWLSRRGAERCAHAVAEAIRRLCSHLYAVDAAGEADPVLRAFAQHLLHHLLTPSRQLAQRHGSRGGSILAGCFVYSPPAGVVWIASAPAAVEYLASLLCVGLALALLVTGCAGPRPLHGGRAVTTHMPDGVIEQTLTQGENPSQATRQTQETVKVRTYTVPAGSRVELSTGEAPAATRCDKDASRPPQSGAGLPQSSILNPQPSTVYALRSPMPVTEREETRSATELGAAQKDMARELGAKLSSLKGIVWVGVGLFVFGLASLVWPPLQAMIASVTTSAALTLGGVALMILPTLVVGNELLILGGVGVSVGGWFLAHRHGQLSAKASSKAKG